MKLFMQLLIPSFLLLVLIEYVFTYKRIKNYYSGRDTSINLALGVIGLAIDGGVKIIAFYLLFQLKNYALFNLGYTWWVWVMAFFSWDLIFYLKHFSEHRIRILWAVHVNHHSSEYYNLSIALRSSILKSFYRYFFFAPMLLIGFPVEMFLLIYVIGKIWAFLCHTQLIDKLGVFEKFLVTPSHHRVHHASNREYLDRNFGETLIIWDKLFGTFQAENGKLDFGVPDKPQTSHLWEVSFHEMKSLWVEVKNTRSPKNKLLLLIKRPGWKPLQEKV